MSIRDEILKSIEIIAKRIVDKAPYDRTVQGRVDSVLSEGYSVKINDVAYTIKPCDNSTYAVRDLVWVMIPGNDIKKQFIIGKVK